MLGDVKGGTARAKEALEVLMSLKDLYWQMRCYFGLTSLFLEDGPL